MRAFARILIAAATCFALDAHAACEIPTVAAVPNGATATEEEMLAAQATVKAYIAGVEAYIACINEELTAAGEDAPAEFKSLMVTRHNSAVTEIESVAAAFNRELQAYRAARPGTEPAVAPPR
jgi:hypothetical protein